MKIVKTHPTLAKPSTRAGAVILVDRGDEFQFDRWVTAWRGTGDDEWCWGHYFSDASEAHEDYQQRTKRGY